MSDNGVPPLSSTTRVVVTVADINDERPIFTERVYRVRIPAMPAQDEETSLFRVIASDRDVGANADIDYSIKTGKSGGRFRIHPKTGIIMSQKAFEAGTSFDLTVSHSVVVIQRSFLFSTYTPVFECRGGGQYRGF